MNNSSFASGVGVISGGLVNRRKTRAEVGVDSAVIYGDRGRNQLLFLLNFQADLAKGGIFCGNPSPHLALCMPRTAAASQPCGPMNILLLSLMLPAGPGSASACLLWKAPAGEMLCRNAPSGPAGMEWGTFDSCHPIHTCAPLTQAEGQHRRRTDLPFSTLPQTNQPAG